MRKQAQGNDLSLDFLILLVLPKRKHLTKTININTLTDLFYSKFRKQTLENLTDLRVSINLSEASKIIVISVCGYIPPIKRRCLNVKRTIF